MKPRSGLSEVGTLLERRASVQWEPTRTDAAAALLDHVLPIKDSRWNVALELNEPALRLSNTTIFANIHDSTGFHEYDPKTSRPSQTRKFVATISIMWRGKRRVGSEKMEKNIGGSCHN